MWVTVALEAEAKQSSGLRSQAKYFLRRQVPVFLVCHKSFVTNFILLEARQDFFQNKIYNVFQCILPVCSTFNSPHSKC